jgi:signal transduction histidine kinase
MDGSGTLTIRTRGEGAALVVEVEDDGPGIPPELVDRVFDPFVTTKPPGEGTGLGLNVSHQIVVQRHRGTITVESEPGRTRFVVRLPAGHEPVEEPS